MDLIVLSRVQKEDLNFDDDSVKKHRYFFIRDYVWQILVEEYNELPIDLNKLIKKNNLINNRKIEILTYKSITDEKLKMISLKVLGFTMLNENKVTIYYDDKTPEQICRFTLAHELGHIFLGHTVINKATEQEANMFAARLLMPVIVLHDIGTMTVEQIAHVCNVSLEAANWRLKRMSKLGERGLFGVSELEKQVRKNFADYVKDNKIQLKFTKD